MKSPNPEDAMTDDTQSAEGLKDCPFCGGKAELDARQGYRAINGHFGTRAVVYCTKCDADMGQCHEDLDGDAREAIVETVCATWNRRAPTVGEYVDTFQICECGDTDCVGEVEIHSPTDTDPDKSCETEPVRQSGLPSAEQGDRSANTSADVPVGAAGGSVSTQSSAGASSSLRSRVQKALTPPTAFADRRSLFDQFTTAQSKADDGWRAHKPGDPMPVNRNAQGKVRLRNGEEIAGEIGGSNWGVIPQRREREIIAYRLAPSQPATVAGEDFADLRACRDETIKGLEDRIAALTAERDALRGRAERYMAAVNRYYVDCHGPVKKTPKHDDPRTAEFRLADDMLRAALTQETGQ